MMLAGKVAIVTGATRGIGLACAETLATFGARVFLAGRSLEQAQRQAAAINAKLDTELVTPLCCDVADPASISEAFQAIFKGHRKLDILVANAGIMEDSLIGMVTEAQMLRVFSVNTFGVLTCSQYATRLMARSGGGSIIAISSIIGIKGNAGQAVYAGSKAAVVGIAKSLAKELAPNAIRVNVVAPGLIDTDLTRSVNAQTFEERLRSVGIGRIGSAQDVANTVLFLASDLSSYVTGQVISVDGGMVI